MIDSELRELLAERLSSTPATPGDPARARRRGHRLRTQRRLALGAGAALTVAGLVAVGVPLLTGPEPDRALDGPAGVAPLDLSQGARAYADPDGTLYLGGRAFPADRLEGLDTDAVATPYGVVFYDDGRPTMLERDGMVRALVRGDIERHDGFHPTAQVDYSTGPRVVVATQRGGVVTLSVLELRTGELVATQDVACGSACDDVVVEAFDGETVFVRTAEGTSTWLSAAEGLATGFAGPQTRILDVRGGVVLYDGPAPADDWGFTLVPGPADGRLSPDGGLVLAGTRTLEPSGARRGVVPVTLALPGPAEVLSFFGFDTDGSVLVAQLEGEGRSDAGSPGYTVYDCVLGAAACERIGSMRTASGDPILLGDDG